MVLGFGNWAREHWGPFDRAIAASDLIGTQLLRSSVRDAGSSMPAVSTLVDSARFVQSRFHKPSMIVDLAISSYPSSSYEARQAQVMADLRARRPELKAAGVRGILYRMIADDPKSIRATTLASPNVTGAFVAPTARNSPRLQHLPPPFAPSQPAAANLQPQGRERGGSARVELPA